MIPATVSYNIPILKIGMKIIQISPFITEVMVLLQIIIEWNLCNNIYKSEETKNRKGTEWKAPTSNIFNKVVQKQMGKKLLPINNNCIKIAHID
jgi:hypothetical protein